ncbi:hypothetical protein Q6D67_07120 [Haliea sp. E1-2-M8]|uniref:hypothetical protein n=1 Tax=Haliea sp. E1-2-M8 TaxID=3064706 RepID=UPI00271582EC|nr:hypothetical protein [Haliea sp. E1-2-M8]MDO8861469.1 hypothetical protein [Haliea sp. E1-2-M8]
MASSGQIPGSGSGADGGAESTISIIQRGNLKSLEASLRKQWRLGQNIVLCWSADERGLLVIFVPHYFLGNYCARVGDGAGSDNEAFVRDLISGRRRKQRDELFAIAERLDVAPGFIKLAAPLVDEAPVLNAVEQLIKRYGLSYVSDRAVLLFDIAEFSLFTPFEQASQLNSLSYSFNSAYNKLQSKGIEVHFSRTTTGDGYYVWNRELGPAANRDLFLFMLLVVADNAVARAASHGNTVPVIRTAFHIGSHYELYQAEGVNPTVHSYIVGDVTIELARMVGEALPHQILVGHFESRLPADADHVTQMPGKVFSPVFIQHCSRALAGIAGVQFAGKVIADIRCHLSGSSAPGERRAARRFVIVDKHGLSRHAYNLEAVLQLQDTSLALGLDESALPAPSRREPMNAGKRQKADTGDEVLQQQGEELATLLQRRRYDTRSSEE